MFLDYKPVELKDVAMQPLFYSSGVDHDTKGDDRAGPSAVAPVPEPKGQRFRGPQARPRENVRQFSKSPSLGVHKGVVR
jgi:hypothetical protein